jgi:hypothetical protein
LKGLLATSQVFQVTVTFTLFTIGLCNWIEETRVSRGRKSCVVEEGVFYTLFPDENWVSFELIMACQSFQVERNSLGSK